jgi:hypothetical protein
MTAKKMKPDIQSRKVEYEAFVERLTGSIIAAIESANASFPATQHALTRALGAIIASNSQDQRNRAAAVSLATRAVAGCAENAELVAKYGRTLRPSLSRMN